MSKHFGRCLVVFGLFPGTLLFSPESSAQAVLNPMPTTSVVDSNGVDLINWSYSFEINPISIGPADQDPIKVSILLPSERDSFSSNLRVQDVSWQTSTRITASIGPESWSFFGSSGVSDTGAQLVMDVDNIKLYARDGTIISYEYPNNFYLISGPVNTCASKITKKNGEVLTYYNDWDSSGTFCRAKSVVSNRGYQIKYEYPSTGWTAVRTKVTLINNAYEYCDPTAITCSLTMAWPYMTIPPWGGIGPTRTYTNNSGQAWVLGAAGLQSPGETTPGLNWTTEQYFAPQGGVGVLDFRVTSVTKNGQTWVYSYPSSDPVLGGVAGQLAKVQDPLGNVKRYRRSWAVSDGDPSTGEEEIPNLLMKSIDENGNVQSYSYNSIYKVTEVAFPEGNKYDATYDQAGNILTYTLKAKPGSGLPDVSSSYVYNGCCNDKPTSITDAKGNVTEYTYDPVHGGVLTETDPAPISGAPRPMKRYAYSQHYAWVKNSSGSYVQAASPVWMLDSEKTCRTSATVSGACSAGASDEITTSYDYGPNSGPNNLWLRGKVVTADGVSLRTCYTYDRVGNKISETKPRAGLSSCP